MEQENFKEAQIPKKPEYWKSYSNYIFIDSQQKILDYLVELFSLKILYLPIRHETLTQRKLNWSTAGGRRASQGIVLRLVLQNRFYLAPEKRVGNFDLA